MNGSAHEVHIEESPLARSGPRDRTRLATLSLHVSAVFYVLTGVLLAVVPLAWDSSEREFAARALVIWGLAALSLLLAAFVTLLARSLRHRRRWAFGTGMIVFTLYAFSVFLPLGLLGLYALLSPGTRARFQAARRHESRGGG